MHLAVSAGRTIYHLSMKIVNWSTLIIFQMYLRPYPRNRQTANVIIENAYVFFSAASPIFSTVSKSERDIYSGRGISITMF